MQYTVIGDANQCVVSQMTLGDEVHAEVSAMVLLSDGIILEASGNPAVMRVSDLPIVNAPVSLTSFRCMAASGVVAFAAPYSGETRQLSLQGTNWVCARESFLFCSRDVPVTVACAHPVSTGYFSEGGYILYKLGGYGEAYIHCGGNVIEYDLSPGQRISVDAGCVAAIQETVAYSLESLSGIPGAQGGSDALFLVTLTGPGKIYLATLPLSRSAQAVKPGRQGAVRLGASGGSSLGNLVREL